MLENFCGNSNYSNIPIKVVTRYFTEIREGKNGSKTDPDCYERYICFILLSSFPSTESCRPSLILLSYHLLLSHMYFYACAHINPRYEFLVSREGECV